MKEKISIEVSRLLDTYNKANENFKSLLESLYGSEIFKSSDEEMYKRLLNLIENHGDSELLVWTEKHVELDAVKKQSVAPFPVKDESGKVIGVSVPIINKIFYFDDVPEDNKEMNWNDAMSFAKGRGRTLPSKKDLHLCYFFKDEINAIAKSAGHPDFLSGCIWSSTESSATGAWLVYFNSGYVYSITCSGYHSYVVRPVADI